MTTGLFYGDNPLTPLALPDGWVLTVGDEQVYPVQLYLQWGATSIYGTLNGVTSTAKAPGPPEQAGYSIAEQPVSGKTYIEALIQSGDDNYARTTGIGVGVYAGGPIPADGIGTLPTDLDMGGNIDAWFAYSNNVQIGVDQTPTHPVATRVYRFGLAVDGRKVWARPVYPGVTSAEPWLLGGDPVAGTTPTFTVPGTAPVYLAGSVRGVASAHMTLVTRPVDLIAAPPAGFSHGVVVTDRVVMSGALAAGDIGGAPGPGFSVAGGTGVGAFRTDGTLPPGITIGADGVATGAYTTRGTYNFYVTYLETGTGKVAQIQQTLTVQAPPVFSLSGTLPGATVGVLYHGALTLGNAFTAPVTIDASAGVIPAWMAVTVSGTTVNFDGTPPSAQTDAFTPRATDASGTPQVAIGPAQSVVVSAPASGIALRATTTATGALGSTTYTINKPSGTAAGDLIIIALSVNAEPATTPAGFTALTTLVSSADGQDLLVFYRVADGSEGASFSGTMAASAYNDWACACAAYAGVDAVTPMDAAPTSVVGNTAQTSPFTIDVPTLTTASAGAMLLLIAGVDMTASNVAAATFSTPAGFTALTTVTSPRAVSDVYLANKVQAAAGATGTVTTTATTAAGAGKMAYLLALRPNGGAVTVVVGNALGAKHVGDVLAGSYIATGGTGPYTFTHTSPLPAGMSISTAGARSGTLTTVQTQPFTVTATDANGVAGHVNEAGVVTAAATTATLSTTRKASGVTLSNGNLTASMNEGTMTGTCDTAACVDVTTANKYWEVTIDTLPAGTALVLGIASSALAVYSDVLGNPSGQSLGLESNGTMFYNSTPTSGHMTFAQGDVVRFWLHNGSLYVGTVAAGWWGGESGGLPTTALQSGITGSAAPGYSNYQSYGTTRLCTYNFGATSFAGAAPAGSGVWAT